jgi:hypothetical protein
MTDDIVHTLSNLVTLATCIVMLLSIYILQKRDYVFKPNPLEPTDPEDEHEEEEHEEEPSILPQDGMTPLTRMCRYGCCPLSQSMDTYYESFTDDAIYNRKDYIDGVYEDVERQYMEAKAKFAEAQQVLNQAHGAYVHMITSSEKLTELYKERSMQAKLKGATLDDMYGMLSAVHKWKPFVHSPDGMYPHEKVMWEKVLWNQIRRAKEHQT